MKIRSKILEIDAVNSNGDYVPGEVVLKSIKACKEKVTKVFDDALCPVVVYSTSGDYGQMNIDINSIIGKAMSMGLEYDENGRGYLFAEMEIFDTPMADHLKMLIDNGANLKIAVDGVFKDKYMSMSEIKNKDKDESNALLPEKATCIDPIDYWGTCDCEDKEQEHCYDDTNNQQESKYVNVNYVYDMTIVSLVIKTSDLSKNDTKQFYIKKLTA